MLELEVKLDKFHRRYIYTVIINMVVAVFSYSVGVFILPVSLIISGIYVAFSLYFWQMDIEKLIKKELNESYKEYLKSEPTLVSMHSGWKYLNSGEFKRVKGKEDIKKFLEKYQQRIYTYYAFTLIQYVCYFFSWISIQL